MKLSLVGQSYALRSPAAACQQSMNLIPQLIEDPSEQAKNKGAMIGAPGYHLAGQLAGVAIRGFWSGGGRLFAIGCPSGGGVSSFYELGQGTYVGGNPSTGSGTNSAGQPLGAVTDDGNPAQMFGNGNQVMIVKNGYAWIDEGSGPVLARFQISGTVNTVNSGGNTTVSWVSGDQFPVLLQTAGSIVVINGTAYQVTGVGNTSISLTVTGNAGTQTGASYTSPTGDPVTAVTGAYLDSYFIVQRPASQFHGSVNTSGTAVTWVSGSQFTQLVPGQQITIAGVPYDIASVNTATSITLTGSAGTQTGALYTAVLQQLTATVNTVSNLVGWVSGAQFDEITPGQVVTIVGQNYIVLTVFDSMHFNVTVPIGTLSGVLMTAPVGADLGGQFNISAPFDGTTWDPLDFATKESDPSYLQSILADHEQLFLFGTGDGNSEVWQNTGDPTFPFQRITGAAARQGSVARYAPIAMGGKVFFLGSVPGGGIIAYRVDGFTPVRISTHAEESAWASGIDSPSGAIAHAEVHDGHQWWVITFPGALGTWVYDETLSQQIGESAWSQWGTAAVGTVNTNGTAVTWVSGTQFTGMAPGTLFAIAGIAYAVQTVNSATSITLTSSAGVQAGAAFTAAFFSRYRPLFHAFIPEWGPAGMHIVSDYANGNWYEENLNYFDDNGSDKAWVRILPHLYAQGKLQFFGRMTLEMETGSTASMSIQPPILRDYSDDRGQTFGNGDIPLTGGAGVSGATAQRVFWPAWGSSRDRVPRFQGTGQYRTTLIDLDMDMEVGLA